MSEQSSVRKDSLSRRDFLKLLGAAGVALAFAPFVPWGKYGPNPQNDKLERAKVILPDGTHANVNTFPKNYAEVVTYPKTSDPVLDEESFRKWQLIRLPSELGGDRNDVSAFRLYSMVCVHLWCLWKYWPDEGMKKGMCPCHASTYDPVTGIATDVQLQSNLHHQTPCQSWIWNLTRRGFCISTLQNGEFEKMELLGMEDIHKITELAKPSP